MGIYIAIYRRPSHSHLLILTPQIGQAELTGTACYPIGKLSQQTWAIKQNVGNTGQTIVITFVGGQAGR